MFRRTVMVFKSKNGERLTIPLNQTALELLKHKYGSRSVETELVFPSEAQTRLNASNISRSLNLVLEKAMMTDSHFHDLRHTTCATRMVQAEVDLYKVQRLLGHKSPIMTQRYAHHYPESLRDGIEVLDGGRVVSTNLARLRVVSERGSQVVEKLVPPIRIERTTNGLGKRSHPLPTNLDSSEQSTDSDEPSRG